MGPIEGSTPALLSLALDATTMRHQAIAHNIANINTPNFTPVGVNFESRLAEARQVLNSDRRQTLSSLADYRPTFEVAVTDSIEAAPVSLDAQVATMSENVLHHQALLKALNKHFTVMGMAISEGKR